MRDPQYLKWPTTIAPKDIQIVVDRPAAFGQPVISGRPQMVVSSAGAWRISYVDVPFTPSNVLAFRSFLSRVSWGLQKVYVGPYDYANAPYIRASATSPITSNFSDGFQFSDSTSFETTIYDCTLAASALEGATQISVTNSATAPLSAGDYFELDGRLHVVEDINGTTWTIRPPLRAAYASGSILEIDDPRMLCVLDPKSAALTQQVQLGRFGTATFDFWEERW